MDSALIPLLAANRAEGKPYVSEHIQYLVGPASNKTVSDNGICFLVGHPTEVDIKSDIGIYDQVYGDHEHKGNISITNTSTEPKIITFIRITFK